MVCSLYADWSKMSADLRPPGVVLITNPSQDRFISEYYDYMKEPKWIGHMIAPFKDFVIKDYIPNLEDFPLPTCSFPFEKKLETREHQKQVAKSKIYPSQLILSLLKRM